MIKISLKRLVEKQQGKPINDLLKQLYVIENKSTTEIAEELDIAVGTVYNWLYRYEISRPKW